MNNTNIKEKIDELNKQASKLASLCFDLREDFENVEIQPLKSGIYLEDNDESNPDKTKVMEWRLFWERFFGHYQDHGCIELMEELRGQLTKNIEGMKNDNKYYPIELGGVYKD